MRTIRKTRPGESHIHTHGTVAGGETIAVDDDTADYLVDSGGYEYADETDTVPVDDALEQGVCPWCDDYEGDAVGQHASSAHEEKWSEYKDAE